MSADALAMPRLRHPAPPAAPPVSNARLAILAVVAGESMLFAGLIGSYLVFRLGARDWPPPNQPRLPLVLTTINTVILLASVVPLHRALAAARRDDRPGIERGLGWTVLLGTAFLLVQGFEWLRLVRHGLTLASSVYGGMFYVLVGCHGAHVLLAVVWLAVVALLARRDALGAGRQGALEMCGLYWYFVCGLWAVLFALVYLY